MHIPTDTRYIRVRATAGARREHAEQVGADLWRISVREKASGGAANARIRVVLGKLLDLDPRQLRLVKGATSTSKTYLLVNS